MTHGNALAVPDPAPMPGGFDPDRVLSLVREDVRQGYALIATFKGPAGTSWMEIRGPRWMRPEGDGFLASEVPTLRLWQPDEHSAPVAVAAAGPGISVRTERLDKLVLDAVERRVLAPETIRLLLDHTLVEGDPDVFRDAVLEAWRNRPIEERRGALDQVLDRVTLDEGGVQVAYSMGADCGGVPFGPLSGTRTTEGADVQIQGSGEEATLGWDLSSTGDLHGDGCDDIATSEVLWDSIEYENAGRVGVWLGPCH